MLGGLKARPLRPGDREAAAELLRQDPRKNLFLLDLAEQLGLPPAPGEASSELWGAWHRRSLVGVASLRPCITLASDLPAAAFETLLPALAVAESGLVKSLATGVNALWARLAERGRRAVVDRMETAYALRTDDARFEGAPPDPRVRPARVEDLPALVEAARASLREESRPDPFDGDPEGFRRWVRGRVARAHVIETSAGVVFVGYADVRRPEGWLVQGVYSWPAVRRRGLALAGVASLCRAAFEAGADHVQLSVVEGNDAAVRLYEKLGFRPFARLRTILFQGPG